MKSPILYFAYGSNMNPTRMGQRCPGSITLGVGVLRNYRLAERLCADIDFQEGAEVHGVLYLISEWNLRSLDAREGYPKVYRRMWLDVEFQGETYLAVTYEMSAATKAARSGRKYPEEYRKICSEGAHFHHVKKRIHHQKEDNEMKRNTVQIIAYGTLMTGERNHRFCRNAVSIRPCTITGTIYDTGWGFPAFRPEGDTTVHAELIEIPIADWPDMDRLEGYPRLYDRMLVPATLEDSGMVEAWVYVMNTIPPQAKAIPSGDWKNRE